MQTMEDRLLEQIQATKDENEQLKQQLEMAQAALDILLTGGTV
jgi:hypothetical protein